MHAASTSGPAVTVRGLTKHYRGRTVVDGLDLDVRAGETLGILGANGAGKTTAVELIAGLRRPDAGHIAVLGLDPVRDRARLRQLLGVQLQEGHLHGSLTVGELIELYRSFYSAPRPREELLELVGLEAQDNQRFETLSGGQQQRTSVALAMVGRPRILVLDELTTGMDPGARRRMWRTLTGLQEEGVTILLVSHAMDEVERLCDRLVLLGSGRVLAGGTPAEVVTAAGAATLEDAFVTLTGQEPHHEEDLR